MKTILLLALLLGGCTMHAGTRDTWQEECWEKFKVGGLECTQVWIGAKGRF